MIQYLGKSRIDLEKSMFPIAFFPVWKRVFRDQQCPWKNHVPRELWAPAGPEQLAHDGDVKWVGWSGEAEDAEGG